MPQGTSLGDLFRESVIFQGALAVICLVGTFALLLTQNPVPDYIYILDGSVVGFFFGARNLLTARNGAQEMGKLAEKLAVQNGEIIQVLSAAPGTPMGAAMAQMRANRQAAGDEKGVGWTG